MVIRQVKLHFHKQKPDVLIHSTAQSPCLACGQLLHRRRTRPPTVCSSPGLPSDQEDRGRRGFIHFARKFVSSSCAVCALPENVCRRRLCAGALLVLVLFSCSLVRPAACLRLGLPTSTPGRRKPLAAQRSRQSHAAPSRVRRQFMKSFSV